VAGEANSGKPARLFFGVGGPKLTSSFHVIGTLGTGVYLNPSRRRL